MIKEESIFEHLFLEAEEIIDYKIHNMEDLKRVKRDFINQYRLTLLYFNQIQEEIENET